MYYNHGCANGTQALISYFWLQIQALAHKPLSVHVIDETNPASSPLLKKLHSPQMHTHEMHKCIYT